MSRKFSRKEGKIHESWKVKAEGAIGSKKTKLRVTGGRLGIGRLFSVSFWMELSHWPTCSCVCSVWSSLSHLHKLKSYPSQPGQPRCPRSPSHSSSWKGHSLLQTNSRTQNLDLPHGVDHFLPVLWCGPSLPPPHPRQRLCLTIPRDPTRTQHRADAQAILACGGCEGQWL